MLTFRLGRPLTKEEAEVALALGGKDLRDFFVATSPRSDREGELIEFRHEEALGDKQARGELDRGNLFYLIESCEETDDGD